MSDLFVIAGLGNPGTKYSETRHNAGFWFLDEFARQNSVTFKAQSRMKAETARLTFNGQDCLLLKPETFMNHSGESVQAIMSYFQVPSSRLLVAYDELDLPVGTIRLKSGGGHGGHNGLRDIFRHWPDHDFMRMRIGIGHPGDKSAVTNYVLGRPSAEEELKLRRCINEGLAILPDIIKGEISRAMKSLHTDNSAT